jgi:hypothetical protein
MTTIIKHFDDIKFTAMAEIQEGWLYVEFQVYEIKGRDADGTRFFALRDSISDEGVASLVEAEPYLSGSVKWDGCSNWRFDEQDRGWMHACTRADLVNMGEVMARCRDFAATLMPSWCGD